MRSWEGQRPFIRWIILVIRARLEIHLQAFIRREPPFIRGRGSWIRTVGGNDVPACVFDSFIHSLGGILAFIRRTGRSLGAARPFIR